MCVDSAKQLQKLAGSNEEVTRYLDRFDSAPSLRLLYLVVAFICQQWCCGVGHQ